MPKCCAQGCNHEAEFEVIFYDVYLQRSGVRIFYEPHESCPYLCQSHLTENELEAKTELSDKSLRRYRGSVDYPHAQSDGQGFCIYRPLT
jgi:hypothetical protein